MRVAAQTQHRSLANPPRIRAAACIAHPVSAARLQQQQQQRRSTSSITPLLGLRGSSIRGSRRVVAAMPAARGGVANQDPLIEPLVDDAVVWASQHGLVSAGLHVPPLVQSPCHHPPGGGPRMRPRT
jgi:hypothetical protein